ncbi:hypothetical protein OH77DRAFT_1425898 [Trametes cingulata]|nr:hypothetical protein OH77DRAFT_1425898 [Trametes cingulata]
MSSRSKFGLSRFDGRSFYVPSRESRFTETTPTRRRSDTAESHRKPEGVLEVPHPHRTRRHRCSAVLYFCIADRSFGEWQPPRVCVCSFPESAVPAARGMQRMVGRCENREGGIHSVVSVATTPVRILGPDDKGYAQPVRNRGLSDSVANLR